MDNHPAIHNVSELKLSDLSPYERNSRKHSKKQIDEVVRSIQEYGFTNPIIIDENNMILAGHCRAIAAQQVGIEDVPCVVVSGLTNTQKRAYVIADNKMALNSSWDVNILMEELSSLDESLTGFSQSELDSMFKDASVNVDGSLKFEASLEIAVEVDTEQQQQELFEELKGRGFKCRVLGIA